MNANDREEFVLLKADVEHVKEDVKETKKIVTDVNLKMTKISNKLFNDDETGEEGYFSLTKNYGVRLTKLENIKVALLTLWFGLGGALGWFIRWVLENK